MRVKVRWDGVLAYMAVTVSGYFIGRLTNAPVIFPIIGFWLFLAALYVYEAQHPREEANPFVEEDMCPCGCGESVETVERRILDGKTWEEVRRGGA